MPNPILDLSQTMILAAVGGAPVAPIRLAVQAQRVLVPAFIAAIAMTPIA